MAKKKGAKAKGKPKQTKKQAKSVLRKGPIRKKAPRETPLPGMEDARIRPLDDICASISETRQQQNDLRAEEAGLEQTALRLLRTHGKTAWRHAGVELIRVPGEEKLRVRTSRASATAESEDDHDTEFAGDADLAAMDAGNERDALSDH